MIPVPVRDVWAHEARHFTQWLLQNADVLSDLLGMDLELSQAERRVGGFSLDLIGSDLQTGSTVIIENQLESTDHTHLGQLLTYAGGTDPATIVWCAPSFRDEHRAAMDWLNEHTEEGVRFFGVEISAIRIEDSPPAPLFRLVVQPNDWTKRVHTETAAASTLTPHRWPTRPCGDSFLSVSANSTHRGPAGGRGRETDGSPCRTAHPLRGIPSFVLEPALMSSSTSVHRTQKSTRLGSRSSWCAVSRWRRTSAQHSTSSRFPARRHVESLLGARRSSTHLIILSMHNWLTGSSRRCNGSVRQRNEYGSRCPQLDQSRAQVQVNDAPRGLHQLASLRAASTGFRWFRPS